MYTQGLHLQNILIYRINLGIKSVYIYIYIYRVTRYDESELYIGTHISLMLKNVRFFIRIVKCTQ